MARITVPPLTVRTTSDSTGSPHGIIAGTSQDPPHALAALKHAAQTHAEQLAAGFAEDHRGDVDWQFEVVDVRLAPGPLHDGSPAWVAYGTLMSRGEHPWSSDHWRGK
jgi:hypothetical protein